MILTNTACKKNKHSIALVLGGYTKNCRSYLIMNHTRQYVIGYAQIETCNIYQETVHHKGNW